MNQILELNNQKYLIRKSHHKLVLYQLPSLTIIHKYYAQIDYFYVGNAQILTLSKNVLTFIKMKCPPLRLIQTQQEYLQWEPLGGIPMQSMIVLYDKNSIAFYYRNPSLEKSWMIQIIQQIQHIKKSKNEKFIALKVKQPKNILFLWEVANMSKKPNQEIILKQQFVKWQFLQEDTLCIQTRGSFNIYFVNADNQHYIQYYISLQQVFTGFCFLGQPSSSINGRRSVYSIAFLKQNGFINILELYDIQKRNKSINSGQYKQIANSNKVKLLNLKCGYQLQKKLILIGQSQFNQIKCLQLNKHLDLQQTISQKQHIGQNLQCIQYSNNRLLFKDKDVFKLAHFIQNDKLQFIRTIKDSNVLLSQNYLFVINQKQLHIDKIQIERKGDLQFNRHASHQFKYSPDTFIIFDAGDIIFFVNSIRCFKYSIFQDKITPMGFVLKNQKAKLKQVRVNTKSLMYKINQSFVLIQYELIGEKLVFKNIKSSQNRLMSLRRNRWAQMTPKQIILGQESKELCRFNLPKFYKTLMQQNNYYQYQLNWITHGGIALIIKNYVFFLQLIEDENGHELHLIRKGHSYLNRRFSSVHTTCKLIDAREMIFYTGNRFIRMNSTIQYFISQNPYDFCDTLLKRQLDMRSYYQPHHPKIMLCLIQCNLFDQIVNILQKTYNWMVQNKPLKDLYVTIQIEDYVKKQEIIHQNNEQKMVIYTQKNNSKIIQQLKKLAQLILNHPQRTYLNQNNPLILQSLISSLIFCLQNQTSLDFYSQPIITKFKIPSQKEKSFTTMDIAFLIHSINKEEAVNYVKTQKVDWNWMVKFSIPLWYDNVEQIKKWVQQIAMNQYRTNKDPFDCLFWYILIGKKNLLITLFKQQKLNSKQHDAMHTFLQRDFAQDKNKTASIKNAYALIDKKRYLHALAFFILGDKIDECIRFILDRLKDMNLAYLVTILNPNLKLKHVQRLLIQKSDVWGKHIGWFMLKKHINSHNILLKQQEQIDWDYTLKLKGYHPCLNEFGKKIRDSISVKRQVQQNNQKANEIQNFNQNTQDDLMESSIIKKQVPVQQFQAQTQKQLDTDYNSLQKKAIKFYLKLHFPCLSLAIDKTHYQSKRAYQLQKYILAKNVSPSVVQIAQGLQDIVSVLKNLILQKDYHKLLRHIVDFRNNFQNSVRHVKINQLNPPLKHEIGELLYYTYFSGKILNQLLPALEKIKQVEQQIVFLKKTNIIGKITIGICLKIYDQMDQFLGSIKTGQFVSAQQSFWAKARQKYDQITQRKKEKHQKLMDSFQFSLNKYFKKEKQQNSLAQPLKLTSASICNLHLVSYVLSYLSKNKYYFTDVLLAANKNINNIIQNWIQPQDNYKVNQQFQTLFSQGIQARLKLKVLPQIFEQNIQNVFAILKIVYSRHSHISKGRKIVQQNQKSTEKQAIQIFKNKVDHLKNFIINKNQGYGLQIAVLFKKGVKKIQVCESLANRDRSHDGLALIHQDSFYNVNVQIDFDNILEKQFNKNIESAIQKTLQSRRMLDSTNILKKSIRYGNSDYMKSLDPIPYMDHNQLHSIQSHQYLPIYLLGGKGLIDVCNFSNLKNFNRILCPGMSQIVKLHSIQNRICTLDSLGNFSCINFDSKYNNKVVFQIKKNSISDFCSLTSSIYGISTQNNVQVYDSLLHPKRQNVFKIQLGSPVLSIYPISQQKILILKKNQLQIYDIRMDHLEQTKDIGGRGKSVHYANNKIFVGRSDCKVKIFDISNNTEETVKVGLINDDKDKIHIDKIKSFGQSYFCMKNDGSIYQFF